MNACECNSGVDCACKKTLSRAEQVDRFFALKGQLSIAQRGMNACECNSGVDCACKKNAVKNKAG